MLMVLDALRHPVVEIVRLVYPAAHKGTLDDTILELNPIPPAQASAMLAFGVAALFLHNRNLKTSTLKIEVSVFQVFVLLVYVHAPPRHTVSLG
jgi:hypothetical protein